LSTVLRAAPRQHLTLIVVRVFASRAKTGNGLVVYPAAAIAPKPSAAAQHSKYHSKQNCVRRSRFDMAQDVAKC
jgi:hypothetical protein